MRKFALIFAFILFFNAPLPAMAVKDASVSFLGRAYDSTRSCGEAEIQYQVNATGTIVDNESNPMGATDFVGVIFTDADGNTVDVDFVFVPTSHVPYSREDSMRAGINNLSKIAKLPLTATLYDIGDIYTFSGPDGTNENYQEAAAFVRTGTQIGTASTDPSHYVPECRSLPGGTFVPPTPVPTAAPTPVPTVAPTATPAPLSTKTPNPTASSTPQPSPTPAPTKKPSPSPTLVPTLDVLQSASDSTDKLEGTTQDFPELSLQNAALAEPRVQESIQNFSQTTFGRIEVNALLETVNTPTFNLAIAAYNLFRLWIESSR